MKIAQIAPLAERIPPKKYGGTERVIYTLTEGLVRRGHQVTLFASGDSITSAKLVSVYPKSLRDAGIEDLYGTNNWSMLNVGLAYQMQSEFDIIHDHCGHISLPVANLSETPVVMTLHGALNNDIKHLMGAFDNPNYISISYAQRKPAPNINYTGNVYHGLDMGHYPFSEKAGKYLLIVGRISQEKGTHIAVKVAQALGMPLIIAAKLDYSNSHDVEYFKKYIKPNLSRKIKWVGEVNEEERNRLMSNALCSLHPVTWPEPFGLTLIEALACGCPVVALNKGSIPEIIKNKQVGFVVSTPTEMIKAVKKVSSISRAECRDYALKNFNVKNMVDGYEQIYKRILARKYYEEGFVSPDFVNTKPRPSFSRVYAHDVKVKRLPHEKPRT